MNDQPTLFVEHDVARRLERAAAAIVLVGAYDGSRNFGDVLQHLEAVRLVAATGTGLPVLTVLEAKYREGHGAVLDGLSDLAVAMPAWFSTNWSDDGIDELDGVERLTELPARTLFYVYGGGYVNQWWGHRKSIMVDTARALVGRRWDGADTYFRLVATGLQVTEWPGLHEVVRVLEPASYVGVRDLGSAELLRRHLGERVHFTADDALPALSTSTSHEAGTLNVHISVESYVTHEPDQRTATVMDLLSALGERLAVKHVNLLVAFPDERIAEGALAQRLAELLPGADGLSSSVVEVVDLIARVTDGRSPIPPAELCVTSSYHVALASLVSGSPAVLLADNSYYQQKMLGLAELFGLPDDLVLRSGSSINRCVDCCVQLSSSPAARAELAASVLAGLTRCLHARREAEQEVTREILHLDGGTAWEQVGLLGRELAEANANLLSMRERLEELLRASRSVATTVRYNLPIREDTGDRD